MLKLDDSIEYATSQRPGFFTADLQIYCYAGKPKRIPYTFQTVNLDLEIDNDDFVQYDGETPEEVHQHYDSQRSIFSWTHLLSTNKKKQVRMAPFNQTCVGVETAHPYRIHLRLIRIDFWKVLLMAVGVFIFLAAYQLSEAPVFYYTGGIVLGIVCSLFFIVYFLGKLLPGVSGFFLLILKSNSIKWSNSLEIFDVRFDSWWLGHWYVLLSNVVGKCANHHVQPSGVCLLVCLRNGADQFLDLLSHWTAHKSAQH